MLFRSSSRDAGVSRSDTKGSKAKWNKPVPISIHRIEVAVDTAYEQYPTPHVMTTLSMGPRQGNRPHESSVGRDLERAIGTGTKPEVGSV